MCVQSWHVMLMRRFSPVAFWAVSKVNMNVYQVVLHLWVLKQSISEGLTGHIIFLYVPFCPLYPRTHTLRCDGQYFALHTCVLLCWLSVWLLKAELSADSQLRCCPASFTHQGDLLQWGVSFDERLHKASAFEDVLKVTCNKFITPRVMKMDSRAQTLYPEYRESGCEAQHQRGERFSMLVHMARLGAQLLDQALISLWNINFFPRLA